MSVGEQRVLQLSFLAGVGKVLNEFRSGGAQGLKAILDSPIADGHRQMCFSPALLPVQDQRAPLIDEVRPKIDAQHRLSQSLLEAEIKLLVGFVEREVIFTGKALQPSLLTMRYL